MTVDEQVRQMVSQGRYEVTFHALVKCQRLNLSLQSVISALASYAEIVEDYPNDPRGHICLVLTFEEEWSDKPLHVVVGLREPDRVSSSRFIVLTRQNGKVISEHESEGTKMTCVYCGRQQFDRREVDYPIYHSDRIIGIIRVVADVCLQCGEYYFDAESVKRIENETKRLLEQLTSVASSER